MRVHFPQKAQQRFLYRRPASEPRSIQTKVRYAGSASSANLQKNWGILRLSTSHDCRPVVRHIPNDRAISLAPPERSNALKQGMSRPRYEPNTSARLETYLWLRAS